MRRLLENGANTSFVNRIVDEEESVAEVVADPVARVLLAVLTATFAAGALALCRAFLTR